MSAISVFGVAAVSAMLVFYALEERAPAFVLLFAGACVASSIYGFFQGAWPFGVVEAIWAAVALRRWQRRTATPVKGAAPAIACDISALTAPERQRYNMLRPKMISAIRHVGWTRTAFQLRLDDSISTAEAVEWMSLEQRCCPFLTLRLGLEPEKARSIEIGGSETIKAFVADEFSAFGAR
jgi:hypothetical protein